MLNLIEMNILFIRNITEYCAVAFHSSLTVAQATDIERIQKTSLKLILGDNYIDYPAALEMSGLQTLYERRERRCLDFALKSLKHPINSRMFPINSNLGGEGMEVRSRETFEVNFARTEQYRMSAVPFCQRKLNEHFRN